MFLSLDSLTGCSLLTLKQQNGRRKTARIPHTEVLEVSRQKAQNNNSTDKNKYLILITIYFTPQAGWKTYSYRLPICLWTREAIWHQASPKLTRPPVPPRCVLPLIHFVSPCLATFSVAPLSLQRGACTCPVPRDREMDHCARGYTQDVCVLSDVWRWHWNDEAHEHGALSGSARGGSLCLLVLGNPTCTNIVFFVVCLFLQKTTRRIQIWSRTSIHLL